MQARAHAQVHGATRLARACTGVLRQLDRATKDKVLRGLAEAVLRRAPEILDANDSDLDNAPDPHALPAHLVVTETRLEAMAYALRMVAAAPDPIGEVVRSSRQRSGMQMTQVRVPIGVLGVLFEDPMMLLRSTAMMLKTGNAVILHHPASEVPQTEAILMTILRESLETHGVPVDSAQLLCDQYRSTTRYLLTAHGEVDLVIPVLDRPIAAQMRAESTVPIADIGAGNCHVYVDAAADIALALQVVLDSKVPHTTRPRAAEQVLVHADVAEIFLPQLIHVLVEHGIRMHVDEKAAPYAPSATPAEATKWRTGYGTRDLGCSVVDSVSDAIAHVNRYGNGHTEAIVTSDFSVARRFSTGVDSGMVTVNAPTTFAYANANPMDPELAFSTHRLAPRGPLKLSEFTTTKWLAWPVELAMEADRHGSAEITQPMSLDTFAPADPLEQPDAPPITAEPAVPDGGQVFNETAALDETPAFEDDTAFDELTCHLIPTQRSRGAHAAPEPERRNRLAAGG